ncbi:GNAT family N-acetyltransferase [Amycolatopsis australiensis]|uniref:Ribosomal protein S18 acetylase RimI n=1 Tax=Amycolatopsis australiensis TaxID=546364 RepID=A0A1K1Q702_9PSEU|nr:GNAT family N-acetyltransferase [Amycolatopsis australiensis]SFW55493.1 Ribosomal protein S18 acetylase RimI [Amycolatopsis australiensis]
MIRIVGPDDWAEWRDLRLAALRDAPSAFTATLADWHDAPERRWRDRLANSFNVVADLDGRAVGMATGFPRDGEVELGTLWVAPHARGRGVGEALVRAVLSWAQDRRVTLRVADHNTAAEALYRRLGFTGYGRLEYQTESRPPI